MPGAAGRPAAGTHRPRQGRSQKEERKAPVWISPWMSPRHTESDKCFAITGYHCERSEANPGANLWRCLWIAAAAKARLPMTAEQTSVKFFLEYCRLLKCFKLQLSYI